ncbi:hypothetical protein [Nitriliruptor alkaliphilus]|uniref:hypothetical protein n=1 Tax=Nitriliruptor alkaliphilus TaxID=427918 RepID=UPI0006963BC1|nr:hypothetical protein [Nitriliruptor alkaliphilus]
MGRWLDRADAFNRRRVEAANASDRRQQERGGPVSDPEGRTWHVSAEFLTAATFWAGWLPFPLDWAAWETIGRRRGEGRVIAHSDAGVERTVRVRDVAQLEAAHDEVRTRLAEGRPLPASVGWTDRPA